MYNYNIFNENWLRNMNTDNNLGMNNVVETKLFYPTEAYNSGNLYSNLYSQYKNYRPAVLTARNEKEQLLLELSRLSFAAHELNLYLDLYPNDETMLALFNDYRSETNALIKQYEGKYGPLSISGNGLENTPFSWQKTTWPWEDRYYV